VLRAEEEEEEEEEDEREEECMTLPSLHRMRGAVVTGYWNGKKE
jgi:hypothetical protein